MFDSSECASDSMLMCATKIGKSFRFVSRALLLFHRPLIIKTRKIVALLHPALAIPSYLYISKRILMGKAITEKEIVKVR